VLQTEQSHTTSQVKADEKKYLLGNYARSSFVLDRGQGVELFDLENRRYLDFLCGIAVTPLGHAPESLNRVMLEQAQRLGHVSNLFHTAPQVELAQALCQNSFADKVFFCNSGTEATEAAMKFARKLNGRAKFVAFESSFHGRTMGALSLTSNPKYREPFEPLIQKVTFCPFNDIDAALAAIDQDTSAVFVEPVQGEGGVFEASLEFIQALRKRTQETGTLLVFDEVQCGLGRTGKLWAHQHLGINPDLMTLAKPLANGLPIGCVLMTQAVADCIVPGDHGSTFAGSPLVCAVALQVFREISSAQMLAQIEALGQSLKNALLKLAAEFPQIVEIRGKGLICGIALSDQLLASRVVALAAQHGLIVAGAGANTVRLLPPYIIEEHHIQEAVGKLSKALQSALAEQQSKEGVKS
jgi:predicted acetylornithine/succinylornithine family transaminase